MWRVLTALVLLVSMASVPAAAGEAEIAGARGAIDGQLKAFLADDESGAYAFAAPNVTRMFPTVQSFMSMVEGAYMPVRRPQSYAFGKSEQMSPTTVIQQVLLVGPDGKNYEAVYTLELQPDGTWRITGCSLRASNALST